MGKNIMPLNLRLLRKRHRDIAALQDISMESVVKIFPDCVLHGGTAIWRCYGGNRFSEDIDVYIVKDHDKIERFFSEMRRAGFAISKQRVKENSIYSKLIFNGTEIRFEALFKKVMGVIREYETASGAFMNVATLTAEELIKEKVSAYLRRRKVRDLYDILFLISRAEDKKEIRPFLKKLVSEFREPLDEGDLKALILFGMVPSSKQIMESIGRWVK